MSRFSLGVIASAFLFSSATWAHDTVDFDYIGVGYEWSEQDLYSDTLTTPKLQLFTHVNDRYFVGLSLADSSNDTSALPLDDDPILGDLDREEQGLTLGYYNQFAEHSAVFISLSHRRIESHLYPDDEEDRVFIYDETLNQFSTGYQYRFNRLDLEFQADLVESDWDSSMTLGGSVRARYFFTHYFAVSSEITIRDSFEAFTINAQYHY